MNLNWCIKHYSKLTTDEFHDLIALRIKVFVIEQNCPYQEVDGKDKEAFHVFCRNEKNEIIAIGRVLPPGVSYETTSIGRIVIEENSRGKNLGHELMRKCVDFALLEFRNQSITISAQKHLKNYYNKHNFKSTGKEYLEDGIPHIEMNFLPNK